MATKEGLRPLFKFVALIALALHSPRTDLKQTLRVWQSKLMLTDWRIGIEMADDRTLGGDAMGDIEWDVAAKRASIRVLREQDYDLPVRMARLDQQATIIHELVHLSHVTSGSKEVAGEEQAVVRETNALLEAN